MNGPHQRCAPPDEARCGSGAGPRRQPDACCHHVVVAHAYVHIGLPKTGTTAFQQVLNHLDDDLRTRGIRVLKDQSPIADSSLPTLALPLGACVIRGDLDAWFRQLSPHTLLTEYLSAAQASIERQSNSLEPTIIASFEGLSLMRTTAEVLRLRSLFASREVHIILVRREQSTWVPSLRRELVAAGVRTWSPYASSCSNLSDDSWLFDHQSLIDVITKTLGQSALTVIDYEDAVAAEFSIIPALWRSCGLPEDLLRRSELGRIWAHRSPALEAHHLQQDLESVDDVQQLRDIVVRQAHELGQIHSSISWRITSPMRTLRQRFGRP